MTVGLLAFLPLFSGDPEVPELLEKVSAAEIRRTIENLVGFHNRNTNGEKPEGKTGVGAARRYLRQKLESYAAASDGRLEVSEDWFEASGPRIKTPIRVANVVARLRGETDPERIYVVVGHYDSINGDRFDVEGFAPGANDDASGTAVVVELARVMSRKKFPATILFVCYVGEEQGLLGSKHHAKSLKEAGAFVDGMITNDIVGSSRGGNGVVDEKSVRVFSASASGSDSPSRQFARYVREIAEPLLHAAQPTLIFRADRFGRGGDHLPFEEAGFPAIRFTEANEDYRHQHQNVRLEGDVQYGDLFEFVDFDYAARVARFNLAVLASLASAPRAPQNVQVKGALSYDTTLSWDPVESADLKCYEVVWRKTTEPYWTESKVAGRETRVVLPVVLDQHVVGVRAISKEGFRSRVSVPKGM